jgi:outer membrane protein TolC
LRQAEQLLAAADADVAAARAAYFPSIDLALTAGTAGRSWGTLLHPATQLWNVAAGVVQPLTRGGAIDAEVAGAQARRRQATARYVQAVQRAFQDSHDAMARYRHGAAVIAALERRIDALGRTQQLAELRYAAGRSGYLDVLNAQRDLLHARTELTDAQRARLGGLIDVFLAIGPSAD